MSESSPKATDLLVEYDGDPAALDEVVQSLGPAVLGQGADAPGYMKRDGYYVVRVFGDPGFVRFALTNQGYVRRIVREEPAS